MSFRAILFVIMTNLKINTSNSSLAGSCGYNSNPHYYWGTYWKSNMLWCTHDKSVRIFKEVLLLDYLEIDYRPTILLPSLNSLTMLSIIILEK